MEDPSLRFALGVQWHPEADETSRFIAALVEEAAAHRAGAHAGRNGAGAPAA
jgi:putative glutamine amidotransferase